MADLVPALARALSARGPLLDSLRGDTDCVRLLHGVVEGAPGVAVDRYGPEVLVQGWGADALQGIDPDIVRATVAAEAGLDLPVRLHPRGKGARGGSAAPRAPAEGIEHGLRFDVTPPPPGRDPLLFLDLRAGRRAVRAAAAGRTVLNLFAYTCGVGVAAAAGGAERVLNVDFSGSALDVGGANALMNGVAERFETLQDDVIPVIRQLSGLGIRGRARSRRYTRLSPELFDLVVLDPPRWSKSPFGAVDLVRDYPSLFKPALMATAPGGRMLVTNNVAAVAIEDWLEILRRAAEKAGRPLRSLDVIPPDADFPSPDDRPPLKMAWLEV